MADSGGDWNSVRGSDKVNWVGAKDRVDETKKEVVKVLAKFTPEIRAAVEACLEKDDHFGLFRLLEDLIEARQIDDVMRRNQGFRRFLASMYGARHPRLELDDVGRAIEEAGAEFDYRQTQQAQPKSSEKEIQEWRGRQIQHLEALRAKEKELGLEPTPPPEPAFQPIPLAPSKGGPAPREPFTSEWTYRVPAGDQTFLFDPRRTCEDFLPPLLPKAKDPRARGSAPPGAGLDEKVMDSLVSRLDDVTRAVEAQEKMKEAVARGEPLPRWRLEVLRQNPRWKEKYDPALNEHEDPPPRVFWHQNLIDLAFKGASPETFTLEDATRLQREIIDARPEGSLARKKRPWRERYPEDSRRARTPSRTRVGDGNTVVSESNLVTPDTASVTVSTSVESPESTKSTKLTVPSLDPSPDKATTQQGKGTTARAPTQEATPELAEVPSTTTTQPMPPANIYNENYLFDSIARARDAAPEDLAMYEYRGWRIHSPLVQLIRIKNFLADEDLDRTLGWHTHFDEIAAYLKHLWDDVHDGTQRWSPNLLEAICMLQTHDLFESHCYGRQRPNVHFETPVFAPRLRSYNGVPGIAVITDAKPGTSSSKGAKAKTFTPRYLVHRVPESIHDVDYQVPAPLLRNRFYTWFREDTELVWLRDPSAEGTSGSGLRGQAMSKHGYRPDFNMAEVEDEAYNECIEGGTNETAAALREQCNFNIDKTHMIVTEDGTMWPNGDAARKFAMFRGAKRAALQQCLRHFEGGAINSALVTQFRKLVLPIPWREKQRLRAEAKQKIFFPPLALDKPPEGAVVDPIAWNHWHDTLVASHERKSAFEFISTHVRDRQTAVRDKKSPEDRTVLSSYNMNGPYVHSFLTERTERYRLILKELSGAYDRVKSVQAKTPRTLLAKIIAHAGMGYDAAESGDFDSITGLDMSIVDEFRRLNANAKLNPNEPIQAAPIADRDLAWLRFILGPSTTRLQLERRLDLAEITRTQPVFMRRLQMLIDNPDPLGFLSGLHARDWHEVPEIVEHINNLGNGGDRAESAVFSPEVTEFICDLLVECGVLNRMPDPESGSLFYRRAFCNLHPEERINWYAIEPVDAHGHPSGPGAFPPEGRVLAWIAAATANLAEAANLAGDSGPSLTDRVDFSFRLLGFRIGYWIQRARTVVYSAYEKLEAAGLGTTWSKEIETHLRHADALLTDWRHESTVRKTSRNDRPTYSSVVKAADPKLWNKGMTDEAYDYDAVELVRTNKARELAQPTNPLWPCRQDWRRDPNTGEETMTFSRGQNIWAFGRDGARGRSRDPEDPPTRFFSMDRWPLHLQTPERKARTTAIKFSRCDLDIEYSTEANVAAAFERSMAEVIAHRDSLAAQLNTTVKMLAEQTHGTDEVQMMDADQPQQQWDDPADLAPPYPEFGDQKWRFVPGVTEFWDGDTRLQRKTLEKQWRERIEGPAKQRRGFWSSLFRTKPAQPPSPNAQDPEISFPKYTDPLRSRIPKSYPKIPPGEEGPVPEAFAFRGNCGHNDPAINNPRVMEMMMDGVRELEELKKRDAENKQREALESQEAESQLRDESEKAEKQRRKEERRAEKKRLAEERAKAEREWNEALQEAKKIAEAQGARVRKLIEEEAKAKARGDSPSSSAGSPAPSDPEAAGALSDADKVQQFAGITPVTTGKVDKYKDHFDPPTRS